MILGTNHDLPRGDTANWVWIWFLTVLILSAVWSTAIGQEIGPKRQADDVAPRGPVQQSWPMPMPNIDQPGDFRYPSGGPNLTTGTLGDVIRLNRVGDYENVLKVWQIIRVDEASVPWRHVGIGAAQLRLNRLDQATEHLRLALQADPNNAVAEYFLGRVYRRRGRDVPLWFQPDESSPYHLIIFRVKTISSDRSPDRTPPGSMLPPFRGVPFDMQAKQHFRRAIRLAPKCNLDQVLKAIYPQLQLVEHTNNLSAITAGDLLKSLGEEDYLEKARLEIGPADPWANRGEPQPR